MTTRFAIGDPLPLIYPSRLCIGDIKELLINMWNAFDPGWEGNVVRFKGKKYLDGGLEFEIEYLCDDETGRKIKYHLSVLPTWEIADFYMCWQSHNSSAKRFKNIFGTDDQGVKSHLQAVLLKTIKECDFEKYPRVRPALINDDWIVFQLLDLNTSYFRSEVYDRAAIERTSSQMLR